MESSQAALLLSTQGLSNAQIAETITTKAGSEAAAYKAMTDAGLLKSKQKLTAATLEENLATVLGSDADVQAAVASLGLKTATDAEGVAVVKLTTKKLEQAVAEGILTKAQAEQLGMITGVTAATNAQTASTLPKWIASLKASTLAIGEQVAAMAKWLVTNPVGWCILASAAVLGVAAAYKRFHVSVAEASEALKDSESEISSLKSEMETLEKQINDNGEAIEKLNALKESGEITSEEAKELGILQQTSSELQLQKQLLQDKIDLQGQNAQKALEALEYAREEQEIFSKLGENPFFQSLILGLKTINPIQGLASVGKGVFKNTDWYEGSGLDTALDWLSGDSAIEKFLEVDLDKASISKSVDEFKKYKDELDQLSRDNTQSSDWSEEEKKRYEEAKKAYNKYKENIVDDYDNITKLIDGLSKENTNGVYDDKIKFLEGIKAEYDDILGYIEQIKKEEEKETKDPVTGLTSLDSVIKTLTSHSSDLSNAYKEMADDGHLSLSTVQALKENYPELANKIKATANGYVLESSAIKDAIAAQIQKYRLELNEAKTAAEAVLQNCGVEAKAYDEVTKSIYDAIKAKADFVGAQPTPELQAEYDASGEFIKQYDDIEQRQKDLTALQASLYNDVFAETDKKAKDTAKKIKDTKEKLDDLAKTEATAALKHKFDTLEQSIEKVNNALSLLDGTMGLTYEDDYIGKLEITNRQLALAQEKSRLLRDEFTQLQATEYNSAESANELASRMKSVADSIADNNKNIIDYSMSITQYYMSALNAVSARSNVTIDQASNMIDRNIKSLTEGSLTGLQFTLSPIVPQSAVEKQRDENKTLEEELQAHYDAVAEMQKIALDMQYQETLEANAKQRQELLETLAEAQNELQGYSGNVQAIQKATNEATSVEQQADDQRKIEETQNFTAEEQRTIDFLNTWMLANPIKSPGLDASWEQMCSEVENYAARVQRAWSIVSGNNGTPSNSHWDNALTGKTSSLFTGNAIVDASRKYIGTPYVYGGSNIKDHSGLDCSGFVYNVLTDAGYSHTRTTAEGYRSQGVHVDKSDLQPGDFVFYGNKTASHVGIYVGNGQIIHSSGGKNNTAKNPGKGVIYKNIDYRKDFLEARRLPVYAKGTPEGHAKANKAMLVGETNENEIVGRKDGTQELVNSPTMYNKDDVEYVVGVNDTKKISYADGTSPNITQLTNNDTLEKIADNTEQTAENTKGIADSDKTKATAADKKTWNDNLDEYLESVTKQQESDTELMISEWETLQGYNKSMKETFSGLGKRLMDTVGTDEYDDVYAEAAIKTADYTREIIGASVNSELDNVKRSFDLAQEKEQAILDYFNKRKAEGASADELAVIIEAHKEAAENTQNLSDTYVQTVQKLTDFNASQAERSMQQYDDRAAWFERTDSNLQRLYDKTDNVAEKGNIMSDRADNLKNAITIYEDKKTAAQQGVDKLYTNEKYADVFKYFTKEDMEGWYDANTGELTSYFEEAFQTAAGFENGENIQLLMKDLAANIVPFKKGWYEANNAVQGFENTLEDIAQTQNDLKIDTYVDNLERVNEITAIELNKQQAIIGAMEKRNALAQNLRVALSEANEERDANKHLKEWLDEDTRKLLFNDDDYEAERKEIESIQAESERLFKNYQNKINSLGETEFYKQEQLTAEYERQNEALSERLEKAQKQLALSKKQLEYTNALKERDTRIILGGRAVQVADPDKLYNLAKEASRAENDLQNTVTTNDENARVRDEERISDSINQEIAAREKMIELINKMPDADKRLYAKGLPSLDEQGLLQALMSPIDVAWLNKNRNNAMNAYTNMSEQERNIGYNLSYDYNGAHDTVASLQAAGILTSKDTAELINRALENKHNVKANSDLNTSMYPQMYDYGGTTADTAFGRDDDALLNGYKNVKENVDALKADYENAVKAQADYHEKLHALTEGKYVPLEPGDVIFDGTMTPELWQMSNNPPVYLSNHMQNMLKPTMPNVQSVNNNTRATETYNHFSGDIIVTETIENADDIFNSAFRQTQSWHDVTKNKRH